MRVSPSWSQVYNTLESHSVNVDVYVGKYYDNSDVVPALICDINRTQHSNPGLVRLYVILAEVYTDLLSLNIVVQSDKSITVLGIHYAPGITLNFLKLN